MSDETSESPKNPRVINPHNVKSQFVDWIISGGEFENVVNLTLGTADYDDAARDPRIEVAVRIRCTKQFLGRLHTFLGNVLEPTGEQAYRKPPENLIN